MPGYADIIKAKYPEARGNFEPGTNFEVAKSLDDEGHERHYFLLWNVPGHEQPTFAELDAYAAGPEYLAAWGAKLKTEAEAEVNKWANAMVVAMKIIEPELFYVAMISNIAFRLLEWNTLGKPETVDPQRFIVTHMEAQAYSETSAPGLTPTQLLAMQETKWGQMQQGFGMIVYKRRKALEKIKLAQVGEGLEAELAAALAELAGS
ncbi:MAG: hypothetical protein L6R45_10045 [Anaerolineae bacterium]|nr:hypothetical protein [Anaerolineae bacterium]